MRIKIEVEVEVERISGKFAPKDEIAEAIREEIEAAASCADVSGYDVDATSEYEVVSVDAVVMP